LRLGFAGDAAASLTGDGGWERFQRFSEQSLAHLLTRRGDTNPSQDHTAQDRYRQTQVGPIPHKRNGEKRNLDPKDEGEPIGTHMVHLV